MITVRPTSDRAELRSSYGGEGTYDGSALGETKHGPWGLLAAAGTIGTDGYIQEAPFQRGPVDIASNMHSQNGLVVVDRVRGPLRLFARGSGMNEARGNGTPFQTNGRARLALRHGRRLAGSARGLRAVASLWFHGALSPDIFKCHQHSHCSRPNMHPSLRGDALKICAGPCQ